METKFEDLEFKRLESEVRRIVFKAIMDTGNYKPDDKMVNYLSSETIGLCKESKFKTLMFGDLAKIFEMGMAGDFNTGYSKESLNMKNISFWFLYIYQQVYSLFSRDTPASPSWNGSSC